MLDGMGGLVDTAFNIYMDLPPEWKPEYKKKDHLMVFPSGARVKYSHMEYEQDKINHQGLQYTFIGFDEGCQFEQTQIEYLMSRLRSESKYPSRMVISCNPDPDHYIRSMIAWYLDDEGFPIPERDGVIRWFIRRDGEYLWGDTKEELIDKYWDGVDPKRKPKPVSFSFIGATIFDNPPVLENNPDYLAWLEGLPEVEKQQLLHGNWNARPEGANYFLRSYLKNAPCVPLGAKSCRPYDKAGTERSSGNKTPDFTATIKISKDDEGFYYLSGDYHPDVKDDGLYSTGTAGRFCKKAGERDALIKKQAEYDGEDVTIIFTVDPGQAGQSEFLTSSRQLLADGFQVEKDPMPTNKSKITRFSPFAKLAQEGYVYIVRSSFDSVTYEALMKELESFNGERSTGTRKDDWADCIASGVNFLEKEEVIRPVAMPKISAPTLYKRR